MQFDKESHKIELRKPNFPQINEKEKNRNSQKTAKVWPSKAYPVETEAITSSKTRIYKEKTKTISENEEWKKRREVGRRYPSPNH